MSAKTVTCCHKLMKYENILSALEQNRGLNRDLKPGPLAPKARIIPLDHWAQLCPDWHWQVGDIDQHSCSQGHAMIQNFICAQASLYSSVAERWSCKPKVMSSILIGGKKYFLKQTNIWFQPQWYHHLERIPAKNKQNICDPDVIRTRSLLIWSQTRYRCATESD